MTADQVDVHRNQQSLRKDIGIVRELDTLRKSVGVPRGNGIWGLGGKKK